MKIQPLADRVLIKPAEAEEKIGGIIIPDTAKEKPLKGEIIATGNGTKDEEMILKWATMCSTANMLDRNWSLTARNIW